MALKAWSAFHPDVLMHVPGCPVPVVDHHLRKAAIDLCRRSKGLKVDMPTFATVAGTPSYVLDAGAELEPVTILVAEVDGVPVDPERIAVLSSKTDWRAETGKPAFFYMHPDARSVRLWKTPDGSYQITTTLAAMPTKDATGIEEWYGNRHDQAIVSGALAELYAIPKKPWTDGGMAMLHAERFMAAVSTAAAESIKDATSAPLRTALHGRY